MKHATREELLEHFDGDLEDCGCESCGFETEKLNLFTDRSEYSRELREFACCDICCTTFTSNAHRYPSQYPDKNAMKTTAYCTNLILEKLDGAIL